MKAGEWGVRSQPADEVRNFQTPYLSSHDPRGGLGDRRIRNVHVGAGGAGGYERLVGLGRLQVSGRRLAAYDSA